MTIFNDALMFLAVFGIMAVYDLELTLVLLPVNAEVQALVTRITIGGSGHVVRRIEYQQADGDRSELVMTPITD